MLRLLALIAIAAIAARAPAYAQKGHGAPDVPLQPGLVSRATPQADPAAWIMDSDYPPAALRAEAEGQVGVVLQIGSDGRVSNCTVVASSRTELLDKTSCRLVASRARFTPAMGKDRRPAPDRWNYTIVWKVPSDLVRVEEPVRCYDCGPGAVITIRIPSPEPLGDPELRFRDADYPAGLKERGGFGVLLDIAPSGRVRRCQVTPSSGSRRWDREICVTLRRRAQFQPEREAESKWASHGWDHHYGAEVPAR